jgi:phosphate butyryltransferase
MIKNFDELITHASQLTEATVTVAWAHGVETLAAVVEAQKHFSVHFILTGDESIIRRGLEAIEWDGERMEIIHRPDAQAAVHESIELLRTGNADILMKGSVDTATMMKMVLAKESSLRRGKLLSDVFIFEYPQREGNTLVMITDGGLTLNPSLEEKVEIIHNAVCVAHALGNLTPSVAVLSASEFVNPKLQSSVDADLLTKMNAQGKIVGCTVFGPLALDGAISPESAKEKKIDSHVAGHAEILIAPNIETANSLAKSTTCFAGYRLAHVIIGASVPILIPSRADKKDAKILSIALGIIVCNN